MHVLLDTKVRTWNKWQCAGPADHHYDMACVVVLLSVSCQSLHCFFVQHHLQSGLGHGIRNVPDMPA